MVDSEVNAHRGVQFGPFELNLETGELRKHGIKLKLQGKPFQILQALVERPGEVVTREELRNRLWAADTFVDFESGLNTAANRLRITLGDSADNPRYVETLARSGYRFIAPVNPAGAPPIADPHPVDLPDADAPEPSLNAPALGEPEPAPATARETHHLRPVVWAAIVLIALAPLVTMLWWHHLDVPLTFSQVTFRRGMAGNGRFSPNGELVIYDARWGAEPSTLFVANTVSPESRRLDLAHSQLASVSRSGELALLSQEPATPFAGSRLSRVPLNGGSPLALADGVTGADWLPDGDSLAVVRNTNRGSLIELPLGKVIYRSNAWISDMRVSPNGKEVAFMEHPVRGDDAGTIRITDARGVSRTLAEGWASEAGLAWSPSGKEVWFTACRSGILRSLYAVDLKARLRLVRAFPGTLRLFDISRTGRVLLSRDTARVSMTYASLDDEEEHDISWFDWSRPQDISADGNLILFDETGQGGGPHYAVYVHQRNTHSTMRLGEGRALSLAPDAKWAATVGTRDRTYLSLVPLGPGQPRKLRGEGIEYQWAKYFPDGRHLLVAGSLSGRPVRLFVQPVEGGKPVPIQPEIYLDFVAISPNGREIAGVNADRRIQTFSLDSGVSRIMPLSMRATPVRWSGDGSSLFVIAREGSPRRILRVNIASGKEQVWKTIAPADPAGVVSVEQAVIAAGERSCVYSSERILSEVYVVDGWS